MTDKKMLTVLHIANLTDDKSKGPNTNVPKNVIYGNKYSNVGLFNLCGNKLVIDIPKDKFFTTEEYSAVSDLPEPFNRPDVVVFQGVYFTKYCRIAKWLKRNGIPYIIVPRCSMTTAGIKSHALKKKIANKLLFNKFVADADSIQFLTKNEYLESKNNFKFKDYFVLGNGVEIPEIKYKTKNRSDFKIVFVGRYNVYHKGLDVLLDVASDNKEWFKNSNASILLYGSDSDDGLKYLNDRIAADELDGVVTICGSVFAKKKEEALLDADVFIHTSRLEGQPTSVVEAISYGIPVIVTPGTNVMDIVLNEKLGFVAEFDQSSIFRCIKEAFNNKKTFPVISKSEIDYAKKNFEWGQIIKKALEEYLEVINRG